MVFANAKLYAFNSAAIIVLAIGVIANAQPDSPSESVPHWIWYQSANDNQSIVQPNPDCVFEKQFPVDQPVNNAQVRIAADFCLVKLSINGETVATIEPYSPTVDLDVTHGISRGENALQVDAEAVPGPAAFALSLRIDSANDNHPMTLVSDETWSATSSSPAVRSRTFSLGAVSKALWGIDRRGLELDVVENYEQWRQAEVGTTSHENKFLIAPEFNVAFIRSALPDEGSWVSMAFDPQERLTIAKEERGLLRLTLDASKQSIEKVEPLLDELLECRGLVYAHNSLYVNANNSKGMYRVRLESGDDLPKEVELLREFPGGVGHGRNDLAIASDGKIYSIHGDSVDLPQDKILDRTSPLRDTKTNVVLPEGHVVRTDADGQNWELLSAGMRNPFGLSQNTDGEWFTYDADAEFDMGSPWYRPTRILQLVSGADFGWRGVTKKWPPYFPDHSDNAMPTLDIGKGSPTAVLFGTGTHFPTEYQRALFVLDWTYGRILAVHLAPRGAGYRAQAETFLQGRPLNVTDVAIGPDGAMYVITGGRKTQSALYRIAYAGHVEARPAISRHETEAIEDAGHARKLRQQLELGHTPTPRNIEFAWQHLNSPDWNIRYAARIAIEHQDVHSWRDKALDQSQALEQSQSVAAIESMMALVRSGESSVVPVILDRLSTLSIDRLSLSQIWGVLRIYSLLMEQDIETIHAKRRDVVRQITQLSSGLNSAALHVCRCGTNRQAHREALSLLAELEAETIVDIVSRSLLASDVQEDQMQGLFILRNIRHGWTNETRKAYFQLLQDSSKFVGGEGMPKFFSTVGEEVKATLTPSERSELGDLWQPINNESQPLPIRPTVRQWTVPELVDLLATSKHQADAGRGATIFRDALCSRCHRSGVRGPGIGPAIGPDLTHVANRFSRRDMIESIITPSLVIAENYRSVQIVTSDGRVVIGRIAIQGDYRSQTMQVVMDPLRSTEFIEIDKREIESVHESPVSPMPANLLDGFTAEEILDLLEYLVHG